MAESYQFAIDWLKMLGYSPDTRMSSKINTYWGWYVADNNWYHYSVSRNFRLFTIDRETIRPAALVAEAWSDLLMNEKLNITTEDKGLEEVLKAHFADFGVAQADFTTKAFAMGTGAWAISVDNVSDDEMLHKDANIKIESYDAQQILPITWSAKDCSQCAFVTRVEFAGKDYDQCQAHVVLDGVYHILTQLFDIKTHQPVYPEGIINDLNTKSTEKTFALVKPAVPNPYYSYCAMGASVYDKGISAIKTIDEAVTSMNIHLRVGRPKMFVAESMIEKKTVKDGEGNKATTYAAFGEADDIVFRTPIADEGQDPMKVIQPEMRIAENEKAINAGLNLLSTTCGLGVKYWSWDNKEGVKTATEVVSDSSVLYKTLKKHQNMLNDSIMTIVRGVAGVCKHLCGTSVDLNAEIKVDFDDSIITDTESDKKMALSEISILGIPALKRKYLVDYCGFNEQDAEKAVPDVSVVDVGF